MADGAKPITEVERARPNQLHSARFFLASVRNVIPNELTVKSMPERLLSNPTSDAQHRTGRDERTLIDRI
jgi:hypothetical protein